MMRRLVALLLFCSPTLVGAQATSVSGRVHVIWDTERIGQGAQYFVVPSDGGPALRITPSSVAQANQLVDLDRQLAQASVLTQSMAVAGEQRAQLLSIAGAQPRGGINLQVQSFQDRTYDFATIMCRFADDPREPFTAEGLAVPHGSSFPGLRYHYLEMSAHPGIMAGSKIYGWYTLPRPRAGYINGTSTSFGLVAQECASAAEADVNFADFYGINVQLNGAFSTRPTAPFDTLSFGGSWTMTLDGQTRSWGVTWMSGIHASNYVVLHHEVGHALGWPHSSGDYGQEYDSRWDLMSAGYINFQEPWGWRGPHTIMPHRKAAGWIASERIGAPLMGTKASVRLARAALSPAAGYQMIEVPLSGGRRYVIEARIPAGLDVGFPGTAVLMHEVRGDIRSYVVDPDRNGNPNDQSAMWQVGETFTDALAGFSLTVDSAHADGFDVTVTRGWTLNVNVVGDGVVNVAPDGQGASTCTGACTRVVSTLSSNALLTATPGPGLLFAGWTGACSGNASCNVVMLGNQTVGAVFSVAPTVLNSATGSYIMGFGLDEQLRANAPGGLTGWELRAGSLPPGVTINLATGSIAGIPEATGTFTFTVVAKSHALEAVQTLTREVVRPELRFEAVIDHILGNNWLEPGELRFLDLAGNRNGRVDIGDVRAWLLAEGRLSPAQREAAARILPPAPRTP